MSYKIVSLKCDESRSDWYKGVAAEAVIAEEGVEKPLYLEAWWNADEPEVIHCEQNNRSVHSILISEKEGDLDARRRGGRVFPEYDRACKSEYGEVFPILKDLMNVILHSNGVKDLDKLDKKK